MKDVTQLTEGWSLRHGEELLEARVPGCVHTDLLAAGAIEDPFLARNETDVAWVGRRAWTYVRELTHDSGHERTDLVFDGLDTAASSPSRAAPWAPPATCTAPTASTSPDAPANFRSASPPPTTRPRPSAR